MGGDLQCTDLCRDGSGGLVASQYCFCCVYRRYEGRGSLDVGVGELLGFGSRRRIKCYQWFGGQLGA